jgi:hypothetical protein
MAPKRNYKLVHETMVEKCTQDLDVPFETIGEDKQKDFEEQKNCDNRDDHENEEEQLGIVLFTPKQWEVLFKMNRPDFTRLVEALKRGSFKNVGFKPVKPRNFDGVRYQKVVDVWLAKMEDYFHASNVGQ